MYLEATANTAVSHVMYHVSWTCATTDSSGNLIKLIFYIVLCLEKNDLIILNIVIAYKIFTGNQVHYYAYNSSKSGERCTMAVNDTHTSAPNAVYLFYFIIQSI